jgi:arabinofuranosyltransferase
MAAIHAWSYSIIKRWRTLAPASVPSSRLHWWSVLGLLIISIAAYANAWRPAGIDDAWITYRYARNIALGHGFVYNLGERVQGASTPLYTLTLAAVGFIGGVSTIPHASYAIGLACFCGTIVVVFRLLSQLYSPVAGWMGAVLLVTSYPLAWISSLGMETPLYAFLILMAFYLYANGHIWSAFIVAALAALTRLEGAIVPAVLLGAFVIHSRRLPPFALIVTVTVLYAAWAVFAWQYFGSFTPHSLVAKQFHTARRDYSWWVVDFLAAHWLLLLCAIAGGVSIARSHRRLMPFVAWLPLYASSYFVSGIRFYPWYVGPLYLVLFMLAASAVGELLKSGTTRWQRRAAIFAAVCVLAGIVFFPPAAKPRGYITLNEETILENARFKAASDAAIHIDLRDTVVSRGIGMIGWLTDCYMIDTAGLVTPALVRSYPDEYGGNSFESAIARFKPRFVFESANWWRDLPEAIRSKYEERLRVPTGVPRIEPFGLWQLRASADSTTDTVGARKSRPTER